MADVTRPGRSRVDGSARSPFLLNISPLSFPPASYRVTIRNSYCIPPLSCVGAVILRGGAMEDEFDDLTARERECLFLATRFMRPKEIAAQLGISPRTVETHLTRSAIKLGMLNSRDAAKLYADHLARYGSEKALTETIRLSNSLTFQSPMAPQIDAEQTADSEVRNVSVEMLEPTILEPLQGLRLWPRKGIISDDLSTIQLLILIAVGTILSAFAVIVVIAMFDAFNRLGTTLSSRS